RASARVQYGVSGVPSPSSQSASPSTCQTASSGKHAPVAWSHAAALRPGAAAGHSSCVTQATQRSSMQSGVSSSQAPSTSPEQGTHVFAVPQTGCASSQASRWSGVHSTHSWSRHAGASSVQAPASSSLHATHVSSAHTGVERSNARQASSGSGADEQGTHSPSERSHAGAEGAVQSSSALHVRGAVVVSVSSSVVVPVSSSVLVVAPVVDEDDVPYDVE